MIRPPAYLSPSRLSCYARCPRLFYDRYVLKLPQPPSVERQFGIAVHRGLEAYYRGQDWEMAFLSDWRMAVKECRDAELVVAPSLTAQGLELMESVIRLGLQGEPEKKITLVADGFLIPIFGVVDLWSNGTIYDFKTTAFGWTQQRADREVFQPAIYSQAYAEAHGELPNFEYIVLPRSGGIVQKFSGTRTPDQILAAFDQAKQIHEMIETGRFECPGTGCVEHREAA